MKHIRRTYIAPRSRALRLEVSSGLLSLSGQHAPIEIGGQTGDVKEEIRIWSGEDGRRSPRSLWDEEW